MVGVLWGRSNYAWSVHGNFGYLDYDDVSSSSVVRPALNLNLNQIKFSIIS